MSKEYSDWDVLRDAAEEDPPHERDEYDELYEERVRALIEENERMRRK